MSALVPTFGPHVPRWGGALMRATGKLVLRLSGWRVIGDVPASKMIVVAAPHTSNWDFVMGMAGLFAMRLRMQWVGKHTLFRAPFGGFMRRLGGIPVNRTAKVGVTRQIAEAFDKTDKLLVAIAPEGTRSPSKKWRSGFYHMAVTAGVPILLAYLDYERRVMGFGPHFMPSGNQEEDMARMYEFYATIAPKFPENFLLPG
ncbi:MAG: lysophospholipid acyltransferase family protein [Bacteroidota bacterium]